jgi:hypothetical protein
MPKYALVMTADSRLLPGVHAMLNASKYYGFHDKIEFHLLYWPGKEMDQFISEMHSSGYYPNFKPVNLDEYRNQEGPEEQGFKPVYYLKFYRSLYAGRMKDYDAVGFMDADMAIVGDISPYFKLAHEADRICMVDWKYNQRRVDSDWYRTAPQREGIHCTSGCPYDPCATFFTPKTWGDHFIKIHKLGMNVVKNSEMPTMNYMIIMDGLLEEIIRLPMIRWTVRKWGEVTTEWEQPLSGHPCQMFINEPLLPDDRFLCRFQDKNEIEWDYHLNEWQVNTMMAIHGRWHFRATLEKKTCRGKLLKRHRALEQNQNIANIWKAFKFFNFCCYTRLNPWKEEWGSPNEFIEVESGLLLKDESKEVLI